MITMTKAEALARQAKQVAAYSFRHPKVAEIVAAHTSAGALVDGVEYDVTVINRHIPRGGQIESLLGLEDGGGN